MQQEFAPIDDFTVWLKVNRLLKERFADTDFRLKEDDEGHLTVIFDNGIYRENAEFEEFIRQTLKEHFGEEILGRMEFSYVEPERFKIIY